MRLKKSCYATSCDSFCNLNNTETETLTRVKHTWKTGKVLEDGE